MVEVEVEVGVVTVVGAASTSAQHRMFPSGVSGDQQGNVKVLVEKSNIS